MTKFKKKKCDKCKQSFNRVTRIQHIYLCHNCKTKYLTRIPDLSKYQTLTIEDVEKKIYTTPLYFDKAGKLFTRIQFPACIAGKRIKILVLDKKGDKEKND